MSSFVSNIQTLCASTQANVNAGLTHLSDKISNNSFLSSPFQELSSAYKSNEFFFKVFLSGCLGYVLYCTKEKIPSVPSYLFVGTAMGIVIHCNLAEIKAEGHKRTQNSTLSDLWKNIGIPSLALFGAYYLLRKHDFVQHGVKSIGIAIVTPIAIAALNFLIESKSTRSESISLEKTR